MSIVVYSKEVQASGRFNDGEIIEKKPIGFPQDMGELKPYSNLFYWANAWTPNSKSTIELHPHQGFEICSFVIKGGIKHYDSKQQKWIPLIKGDVQIIRAGSGISHAEEILDKSEIFQIWFDPDISKTLNKPATYDDYKQKDFPVILSDKMKTTIIKGDKSLFEMDSEGVEIKEYDFDKGVFNLELDDKSIYSFFLINGSISIENDKALKGAFVKIQDRKQVSFDVFEKSQVFEVKTPKLITYSTYFERFIN
ncbi:pirin family protein [Flavobacteriaceae bacterium]|jgi:redox-sensitive bicupin YhaK (pirin superfamily)|nr:pirin family protein [Flavobacteriaceae bacterium]|tara:strand:+ start:1353 stop:2108 length:756 start_codon:yes stop_codon:yes gene_type:complete